MVYTPAPSLIHDFPAHAAQAFGERTFLEIWSSLGPTRSPISFAEFERWFQLACTHLGTLGISRGSRVAMLAHACPDSLALSLAVPALGGILVNLNWRQPKPSPTKPKNSKAISLLMKPWAPHKKFAHAWIN